MNQNYKNSYIVSDKKLVSLSVYNVGYQLCDPLYQWGPGIRDHYLIHYIISGEGYYTTKGITHHLHAGDSFLVYPNTEVTYYADEKNPWEYAWVGFTGSDAAMILQATDFSKASPVINKTPDGSLIQKRILEIYDNRGNEYINAVEMTGGLYTLLAIYMQNATKKTDANTAQSYVQKAIEFITSNYSYPITVEDIASYVGLSRSHLFRSFETVLGESPKEYLTKFRMKQACYLLENTNLSITTIANSLGFDNSLYFSKIFHKELGISPKAWRKKKDT